MKGDEPPLDLRRRLARYLDTLTSSRRADIGAGHNDRFVRRLGKRVLPTAYRQKTRRALTRIAAPRARRSATRLTSRHPLKLHLGSGPNPKTGWVNVDLAGDPVDVTWDLTSSLPFPDASVDAVFMEHVLTVLPLETAFELLLECSRVLKPGGVFRIAVPDPWKEHSELWRSISGGVDDIRLPRLLAMQEVLYYPGNRSAYDTEALTFLLEGAGLREAERHGFGESRLDPCRDSEHRRAGTLYVEAIR